MHGSDSESSSDPPHPRDRDKTFDLSEGMLMCGRYPRNKYSRPTDPTDKQESIMIKTGRERESLNILGKIVNTHIC